MGNSFSGMRKKLEQDYICNSLKGRVQYFATRYRKVHDREGRIGIHFDKKEVFQSSFLEWAIARGKYSEQISLLSEREYRENMELWDEEVGWHIGFDHFRFYSAFYEYDNQSIEKSLVSDDDLVRLFAIFDRRVGKRRLKTIGEKISQEPVWIQYLFSIRKDAEKE